MPAVAGANHQRTLACPRAAVLVLARMQDGPLESLEARDVRPVGDSAYAGGQHDVTRMQRALRPIGLPQADGPASGLLIIRAAFEFGARPVVELHALDISLEPSRELVL